MERQYNGLADVALQTRELDNYGEDNVQLNYDIVNDKVWIDPLESLARSSVVKYEDVNIIHCGVLCHPSTRREIREQIERTLRDLSIEY